MYGQHPIPFRLAEDGVSLSVVRHRQGFRYSRTLGDDTLEKRIISTADHIILTPVEPVNLPGGLAHFLFVDIENPVMMEPGSRVRVYLKFPVEIGVFMKGKGGTYSSIDVITLARQKLTMYGEGPTGIICKYHSSRAYNQVPKNDPKREGVLEISVRNHTPAWVEFSKAVLNANGMKLFYGPKLVAMRAQMNIRSEKVAETHFIGKPLRAGMKKGIELYTRRLLAMEPSTFVMEAGI